MKNFVVKFKEFLKVTIVVAQKGLCTMFGC